MTNEEEIEEILYEASAYGLRVEVIQTASQMLQENPNMDKVTAYQIAYEDWIK